MAVVIYPIIWVKDEDINSLISAHTGAFADRFFKYLRSQGYTGAVDEMLYNWLGDLGYTGTIEERMRKWEASGFVVASEAAGSITFDFGFTVDAFKKKAASGTILLSFTVAANAEVQTAGASGDASISFGMTAAAARNRVMSATMSFSFGMSTTTNANLIPAVVYDGVQGHLKHTGGPTGAADGTTLSFGWAGTLNSDDSAMTFLDIPGTVPVKVYRDGDNTIHFEGGTGGAVFSNATTAVAASTGFLAILANCNGTSSTLKVVHAGGIITGSNSAGSAATLDLTADWYLGSDGGAAEFLDADTAMWWIDDAEIDFSDSENIEQFWDTTNDLLRNPGADGSNPTDGAVSPLICHKGHATSHTVNSGTGGDADTAGIFTNGTSPGAYAADFTPANASITFTANPGNTANTGTFTFNNVDIGSAAADRYIITTCHFETSGAQTFTGCTIDTGGGAQAMTELIDHGAGSSTRQGVYILNVQSGTTATIVFTTSSNVFRGGLTVHAAYGINPTPSDSDTTSGTAPALSVTVPSGGILFAVATSGQNTSCTFTGVTETSDAVVESSTTYATGTSDSASGATDVTATFATASATDLLAAIAFAAA